VGSDRVYSLSYIIPLTVRFMVLRDLGLHLISESHHGRLGRLGVGAIKNECMGLRDLEAVSIRA
jgi:hypothetical protein